MGLFCDWYDLTGAICVTIGLELLRPGDVIRGYGTEDSGSPSPEAGSSIAQQLVYRPEALHPGWTDCQWAHLWAESVQASTAAVTLWLQWLCPA